MKLPKIFVRDGNEVYGIDEVEQVEELSPIEIAKDIDRALTHLNCGMKDYSTIIKKRHDNVLSQVSYKSL